MLCSCLCNKLFGCLMLSNISTLFYVYITVDVLVIKFTRVLLPLSRRVRLILTTRRVSQCRQLRTLLDSGSVYRRARVRCLVLQLDCHYSPVRLVTLFVDWRQCLGIVHFQCHHFWYGFRLSAVSSSTSGCL